MGDEPFRRAMDDILAADLAARLVVRTLCLLQAANPDDGHLTLSWPAALTMFGVESPGSVRRVLGELQAAHVVHYSTGEEVYVDFCAWKGRRTRITRIGRMRRRRVGEWGNGSVGEGEGRVDAQEMVRGRAVLEEPDREGSEVRESCAQSEEKPRVDAPEMARGRADLVGVSEAETRPSETGALDDEKSRVDAPEMARGRADLVGVIEAGTGPNESCAREEEKPRVDAPEMARGRADLARVGEDENEEDESCALDEPKSRVDAPKMTRGRADASRAYACARDRLIDINIYPDPIDRSSINPSDISSTNQSGRPRPSPAEVAANRRLLADPEVRVGSPTAVTTLAEGFPFEELLRHVFAWKAGRLHEPGALVYRCRRALEDPNQFQPPRLGADERASELYRRHAGAVGEGKNGGMGEWENGRAPAEGYALGEEESGSEEEWGPWQLCLADLRCRMMKWAFEECFWGSRAVREGDRVRVRTPQVAEWLDKRMRPVVELAVKAVTGERLEMVFVGETANQRIGE